MCRAEVEKGGHEKGDWRALCNAHPVGDNSLVADEVRSKQQMKITQETYSLRGFSFLFFSSAIPPLLRYPESLLSPRLGVVSNEGPMVAVFTVTTGERRQRCTP
jgi:hypothetical protein